MVMQNKKHESKQAPSKWKGFFKLLIILNILTIGVPLAIFLFVVLLYWNPGSGYIIMAMAPLAYAGVGIALLNAITIPVYLLRKKPKLKVTVLCSLAAIISAMYFGFAAFHLYQAVKSTYEMNRALSRSEAIRLINDCQVGHIVSQNSIVQMTPREGFTDQVFKDGYYRRVKSGSFNEFRQAVNAVYPKCGAVKLSIWTDPSPIIITPEQATELITQCNILSFNYFSTNAVMQQPGLAHSGIIDLNLTRVFATDPTNLQVPPHMVERLLPVAKEAQKQCTDLTIRRDGQLEQ